MPDTLPRGTKRARSGVHAHISLEELTFVAALLIVMFGDARLLADALACGFDYLNSDAAIALSEWDGEPFHSSDERKANDVRKTKSITEHENAIVIRLRSKCDDGDRQGSHGPHEGGKLGGREAKGRAEEGVQPLPPGRPLHRRRHPVAHEGGKLGGREAKGRCEEARYAGGRCSGRDGRVELRTRKPATLAPARAVSSPTRFSNAGTSAAWWATAGGRWPQPRRRH